MSYGEFVSYISGLNADTALGHIVQVRSEKDYEKIKKFTPAEKKIKNDWDKKYTRVMSEEEYERAMKNIEKIFISMGKGGNG